jgi:hypothetical protein
VDVAEPAARDHRRPAHADRCVRGGHDQVGGPRDDGVTCEAASLHDRDPRHQARQRSPQLERARLQRGHRRVIGVARPAAATFGEEDGRQSHPLDQFEQPVLLAVAEIALGACEDGVVVGQHGRGAAVTEVLAVDAGGACHQTVGGRAGDQIVEVAAEPLGGDREPAVLDERPGIDEIVDVLAGGAPVRRASALDRIRPCGVLGQRAPAKQFGMVVSHAAEPNNAAVSRIT